VFTIVKDHFEHPSGGIDLIEGQKVGPLSLVIQ